MKKHVRKRSVNTVSSSVLYMFIKKDLRLTVCKKEMLDDVRDIVPSGLEKLF